MALLPRRPAQTTAGRSLGRTVIDENGRTTREEFILQPLLDKFHENNVSNLCFDIGYTIKNLKILDERLKTGFNWVAADVFLNKIKSNITKNSINFLTNSVNKLIKSGFGNVFVYRGINLSKYMKPVFSRIMEAQSFQWTGST